MLTTYLWTTLRNLRRDLGYALINIIGLAVGIACFITLALYLEVELSYDRHYNNHENIYRLIQERTSPGVTDLAARSSGLIPPVLVRDYPEVLDYVRFRPASSTGRLILRNGNNSMYWDDVFLADDNIFQVFSSNIVYGDPVNGLVNPTTIAYRKYKRYL